MQGEVFVLLIVFGALAAGLIRRYMWLRESRPREDPAYRQRIDALEQRVQTLERIITDKGYDLKREFEKL